jgi:peptidylprolyl isomerase
MVHLKLKNFEAAVEDASLALALDPSHVKTLQRRAYAYIGQGMHHAALRDIDKALGYHPDNKELRVEKKRLEEKLKSLAPIEVLSSSSVSNDSGVGLTGN